MKILSQALYFVLSVLLALPVGIYPQQSFASRHSNAVGSGTCHLRFGDQIDAFIKLYNKRYPDTNVWPKEVMESLGQQKTLEVTDGDHDVLIIKAANEVIAVLHDECSQSEADFTGIITSLMERQLDATRPENNSVSSYRALRKLIDVISATYFTPELNQERRDNHDSLIHNSTQVTGWVMLGLTIAAIPVYYFGFKKGKIGRRFGLHGVKLAKRWTRMKKYLRNKNDNGSASKRTARAQAKGSSITKNTNSPLLLTGPSNLPRLPSPNKIKGKRNQNVRTRYTDTFSRPRAVLKYDHEKANILLNKAEKGIELAKKRLSSAKSSLKGAKRHLSSANNELKKNRTLMNAPSPKADARANYLASETKVEAAKEQVRRSKNEIYTAKIKVDRFRAMKRQALHAKAQVNVTAQSNIKSQTKSKANEGIAKVKSVKVESKDLLRTVGEFMFRNGNWKKTLGYFATFSAASAGLGAARRAAYRSGSQLLFDFSQLPIDFDEQFHEQNYMLALSTFCEAKALKNDVLPEIGRKRDYRSRDRNKVTEDAQKINQLSVAYSLIYKPSQPLKAGSGIDNSAIDFAYDGPMPKAVHWNKKDGVATSSIGQQVTCNYFEGKTKKEAKISMHAASRDIADVAKHWVNNTPSEPLIKIMDNTSKFLSFAGPAILREQKTKLNDVRNSIDEASQQANGNNAHQLTDFEVVMMQLKSSSTSHQVQFNSIIPRKFSNSALLTEKQPQEYLDKFSQDSFDRAGNHRHLLAQFPLLGGTNWSKDAASIASAAYTLSAKDFNRWWLSLLWRFVNTPTERLPIYLIYSEFRSFEQENEKRLNASDQGQSKQAKKEKKPSLTEYKALEKLRKKKARLSSAALIMALLYNNNLENVSSDINLFKIPEEQKPLQWMRNVVDQIAGESLPLSRDQLSQLWVQSPIVLEAALHTLDQPDFEKNPFIFTDWIELDALNQPDSQMNHDTALALRKILPLMTSQRVDTATTMSYITQLAINKASCNVQTEMQNIQRYNFEVDPKDPEETRNALDEQTQFIANNLLPSKSPVITELDHLSSLASLLVVSSPYQSNTKRAKTTFSCNPSAEFDMSRLSKIATNPFVTISESQTSLLKSLGAVEKLYRSMNGSVFSGDASATRNGGQADSN